MLPPPDRHDTGRWGGIIAEAAADPTVIFAEIDPALVAEAVGRGFRR